MANFKVVSFMCVLFCLTACETVVINRGYIVDAADFGKIVIGKDNTDTVFNKFGSPTIRSSVVANDGSYRWYYVYKKTEKRGFLDAKIIDQKTKVILFDKDGIVRAVTESSYEKPISTVSETTKSGGKDAGIIGETFGGLGKYMKRYSEKEK
ncbi:MAG: outer membrane protein assembly factor BamE [Holosporales bacterium]|jgi:outer membrane protein assembly factor BamE (lipoprotein component of BamABCDE complex)|nr:outer membrane protein assembly factor BamE [Holosporales bacterium]